MRYISFFILFIMIYIPTLLHGQETDISDTVMLENIVITATRQATLLERTPEVMRIVNSKEIRALNAFSTGEVLEYVPGLNIESGTGSGLPKRSIVSMNGFPPNYSLIFIDGVNLLSDHIHTGQNIDLIPPEFIERIEIIKGASSAQYGSDAMGGIINIITKKCGDKPEFSFNTSLGSFNTYSAGMGLRAPINEKIKVTSFVNWEQSEGSPILKPEHRIGNMGYSYFALLNSIDFNITEKSNLNAFLYNTRNKMEWQDDHKFSWLIISGLNSQNRLSRHLNLNSRVNFTKWFAEQSDEENELIRPEVFISYDKIKNNRISLGADYRYTNFKRSNVLEKDQQSSGIFLQDEINFEKLSLFMALRYDKVENINGVFSPKFGILYEPAPFVRLRGSAARGFHAPTVQELYEIGSGHGGRAYRFGNPDLEPEYSITSTIGTEFFYKDIFQLLIYGYYNTIDNMITPVYQGPWEENPEIDKWVRVNIHNARIYGYEFSGRWKIKDNLEIEGGYTYTDNKNTSTGGILPYYPGKSYYSKVYYTYHIFKSLGGSVFIGLKAVRNRSAWNWQPAPDSEADDPNGLVTPLSDYEWLSAGLRLTYHQISVFLNADNLLGQEIEKLDDVYTVIKGEPFFRCGISLSFDGI